MFDKTKLGNTKEIEKSFKDLNINDKADILSHFLEKNEDFDYQSINDYQKKQLAANFSARAPEIEQFFGVFIFSCERGDFNEEALLKILRIGCSLGRLYHMYSRDNAKALPFFKELNSFFKKHCPFDLTVINFYGKEQKKFDKDLSDGVYSRLSDVHEELLVFYARELLFHLGKIISQSISRKEFNTSHDASVPLCVTDLQQAYRVTSNSKSFSLEKNGLSVAYIMRAYARAVKKSGNLDKAIRKTTQLQELLDRIPNFKDDNLKKSILIDMAINKKELEDQQGTAADYSAVISDLESIEQYYKSYPVQKRIVQDLNVVQLYLGQAYEASNQLEKAVQYYLRMLVAIEVHLESLKDQKARAYFSVAHVLEKMPGVTAFACWYAKQAVSFQIEQFGAEHSYVLDTQEMLGRLHLKLEAELEVNRTNLSIGDLAPYLGDDSEKLIHDEVKKEIEKINLSFLQTKSQVFFEKKRHEKVINKSEKNKEAIQNIERVQIERDAAEQIELDLRDQTWYINFFDDINLRDKKLKDFRNLFSEALLNKFVEFLRKKEKSDNRTSGKEILLRYSKAVVNSSSDAPISIGSVPSIFSSILDVAVEQVRSNEEFKQNMISEAIQENKLWRNVREQVNSMARYATRIYSPQIMMLSPEGADADIELLAKEGAKRVANWFSEGHLIASDHLEEKVINALTYGIGEKTLSIKRNKNLAQLNPASGSNLTVSGFFARSGVKFYPDDQTYVGDNVNNRPEKYGFRYGSPYEKRNGSFKI